jgi:hypothetical protein
MAQKADWRMYPKGAIMKSPSTRLFHASAFAAVALVTVASSLRAASTTFLDDFSTSKPWDIVEITGSPNSYGYSQSLTCGPNNGPCRQTTFTFNSPDNIAVAQVAFSALYSGPVATIDFTFDGNELNPTQGATIYELLLFQNDTYYAGPPNVVQANSWTPFSNLGLTAASFTRIKGTGPASPNFQSSGPPMIFGFITAADSTANNGNLVDKQSSIANFSVTVRGSAGCASKVNANTLCIDDNPGDDRFMIQVSYKTSQSGGLAGAGGAISLSNFGVTEGGLFWFFSPTNPEMLIKIINACSVNSHFWVFYAATTNVGFTVTVTDTQTSHQAIYNNKDLTAAPPVQDTSALACP